MFLYIIFYKFINALHKLVAFGLPRPVVTSNPTNELYVWSFVEFDTEPWSVPTETS